MRLFDISRTLSPTLAAWPGDEGVVLRKNARIADGASVNLGAISLSLHNGSHADATFHFEESGITMERMPLAPYFGPAVVIDLRHLFADGAKPEIQVTDLEPHAAEISRTTRLLLRTDCWPDSREFPEWIPVLAADVPAWLGAHGVQFIGFDVPSVDRLDAKQLDNHHALAAAKIAIVESLDLSEISPGAYELAALPLKIEGGDGAPVRAILWRDAT